MREADGFLGARAQGNFGEISADTAFAGIGGDWAAMQDWRLLASAYLGHTKADTGDGMLRAADDIVSSAFSLGLARAGLARRGDWLGLRLSQPLRAESGARHLRIPAGRTKYREVLHRQHKLELTPSGRNLQVEAEYRIPLPAETCAPASALTATPTTTARATWKDFCGWGLSGGFRDHPRPARILRQLV